MRTEKEIRDELVKAQPAWTPNGMQQTYHGSAIAKYVMEWVLDEHSTPPSKTAGSWK